MTFIQMLSAWQWLLLALVPPAIILLYFLKLKRHPVEVPSTYLWRKSIEDLRVNSIWQRLRQNILLLLQLLLILLAMGALLRPGWQGSKLTGGRYIFLVDNSASMAATDVGTSRLAEAKRRVAQLIDEMESGDVAMIISFADVAQVMQPFTDNRRELHRRLDQIRQTNRSTALGEALRVASGLANPGRSVEISETRIAEGVPATMYIFSDGKFPDVEEFSLGYLKPVFVTIGEPKAENIGIAAFSTRRIEGKLGQVQAFARIDNFSNEDVNVSTELYLDDTLVDAANTPVKRDESGGVVFSLGEVSEGVLRLKIRTGGALTADDEAWMPLNPPRRSKVLVVSPGNGALEVALGTEKSQQLADIKIARPEVLKTADYKQQSAAGAYDLIIYDQCQPGEMPQANTFFIGQPPPLKGWTPGKTMPVPQILDVETAHPLMQLIDLGDVRFAEGFSIKPPPGGSTLIDSNIGPLLAIGPREGFEDAVMGAGILMVDAAGKAAPNTDWPLRLSFPVFVMNVLEYLGGRQDVLGLGSLPAGQSVALASSKPTERLTVAVPSGRRIELRRGKLNTFNFNDTEDLGIYAVLEDSKPSQRFAVNLFDSAESNIRPREKIGIGYVDVKAQTTWEGARQELWKPLVAVALVVLLVEWYIYNRRVYV